jgi:hypothetical protein
MGHSAPLRDHVTRSGVTSSRMISPGSQQVFSAAIRLDIGSTLSITVSCLVTTTLILTASTTMPIEERDTASVVIEVARTIVSRLATVTGSNIVVDTAMHKEGFDVGLALGEEVYRYDMAAAGNNRGIG